jgi:hypothetical protein
MVTLPIASAKSYGIAFSSPTMVGNTQLPAGQYTLKVEGSNAVITNDEDNYKSVTVPIKIANVDKKYDETAVVSIQRGDAQHVTVIELGGSKTKLDFN